MRILGIDTNTFYLAISLVENGRFVGSKLLPDDGPQRKADHPKKPTNRNKLFENRSTLERRDVMCDLLQEWLTGELSWNGAAANGPEHPIDYCYIEEAVFVNSAKAYADLSDVVALTRHIVRDFGVPVTLVNNQTWKKEAIGNAKADKTEIREWAIAHTGIPAVGYWEDEYDATVIAFRGAVAAGDVR